MKKSNKDKQECIARMLGGIYSSHANAWGFGDAKVLTNEIKFGGRTYKNVISARRFETELKFDSDWNWLIEAIQFIEKHTNILPAFTPVIGNIPDIEKTFEAVADFAERYEKYPGQFWKD